MEGRIIAGNRCLIIDDVCTSGQSIIETAQDLQDVGLTVTDAVVLLDRQATGAANLAQHGIRLHAALSLTQICTVLVKSGHLSEAINSYTSVHKLAEPSPNQSIDQSMKHSVNRLNCC